MWSGNQIGEIFYTISEIALHPPGCTGHAGLPVHGHTAIASSLFLLRHKLVYALESVTLRYWHYVPIWVRSASFCGNPARRYRVQLSVEI